jgi:site-specific DNA-methyltransferase (adenine-specific)
MLENYGINIYNRDCLEAMKEMPDNAYQLAICDPPYGIDAATNGNGSRKRKYERRAEKNWDNNTPTDGYWRELFRISNNQLVFGMNYFGLICKHFIVWDKKQPEGVSFAQAELVYTSFTGTSKIIELSANGQEDRIHPTQKPVALYKWLLDKYAKEGDKILDTHGGSMSIAIAAYEYGFSLDLYELDKDYYETGKQRVENHIQSHPKLF